MPCFYLAGDARAAEVDTGEKGNGTGARGKPRANHQDARTDQLDDALLERSGAPEPAALNGAAVQPTTAL
jgi:hypothetical protein